METTGIVRRIDELGRIVIPKEIRRTLRIKDGSSLEILVEQDMVVLKKSSSVNDLKDFANVYAQAIYKTLKINVLITDRDIIIACAGRMKKKYLNLPISKYLEEILNTNKEIIQNDINEVEIVDNYFEKGTYAISPIISNGRSVGLIIMLCGESKISEVQEKALQVATTFLGKHIEE